MGGKKNKRGSIPSTSSVSKTELIERTPENDYGVLSDPEENEPFNPVHLLTETEAILDPSTSTAAAAEQSTDPVDDACSHIQTEPSQLPHVSPHSSPSLQPQHPPSQLLNPLSQEQEASQSLSTLKLKLDKNYSRKITLHTFFSYIILAIEIERSSSSCIENISANNVEELVEYMIDHHSATEDIKKYLHTLLENNVIKNLISAVIDFNKDQSADTLDTLLSAEQIEMNEPGTADSSAAAAADSATHSATHSAAHSTIPIVIIETNNVPHSRSCGFFSLIRRFFSRCCG